MLFRREVHSVLRRVDVCDEFLKFGEVIVMHLARTRTIFDAQGRSACRRNCVLSAITHELGDRPGDMGDTDVLAGHHEVVNF